MTDTSIPFHLRLRAAIEASGRPGQTFEAKTDALYRHMNLRGIRGGDATSRTLRRWLAGKGYPPDHWCDIAAVYLRVRPRCIRPTERERRGETTKGDQAVRTPAVRVSDERWAAETVYIVGGGPSAGRHDLSQLHHHGIVIAVNDSAAELPDASVVFTASPPWVRHRIGLVYRHRGQLVVRTAHSPGIIRRWKLPPEALILPFRCVPTISETERSAGHNSGTEAIYWAAAQGTRRIVLIGFDMDEPGHWHGGYEWFPDPETRRDAEEAYPLWVTNMERVMQDLAAAGVECLNANPTSAIHAFPLTELPVPLIRRDEQEPLGHPLTCAVIIPVGPGHEAYSDDAVRSVLRSWEHDPGPFTHLWIDRVWDVHGELGRSQARNVGLDRMTADWHFLLDADDTMMLGAFGLVDRTAPATFGTVLMDKKIDTNNVWPLSKGDLRELGSLGTLSMGCFVRGNLGLRFREGFPVGQDFDFYCRLPGFTKRKVALVNIGYRKPRAGPGEKNREAIGWIQACNAIIESYFGPSKTPKPVPPPSIKPKTKAKAKATKGVTTP